MIQANADSFSDVNLVPEQWWPMLCGEGITKHILTEPIVLEWGIGNSKTFLEEFVELSVKIAVGKTRQAILYQSFICQRTMERR